jgi:hypothetical protein
MPYGAAAQKSEACQRSAGKGKKRAQLPAVERAVWVKKFKESGARSAAAGTAGLAYANKPHILDAMEVLNKIWNDDQLTTTVGLGAGERPIASLLP